MGSLFYNDFTKLEVREESTKCSPIFYYFFKDFYEFFCPTIFFQTKISHANFFLPLQPRANLAYNTTDHRPWGKGNTGDEG